MEFGIFGANVNIWMLVYGNIRSHFSGTHLEMKMNRKISQHHRYYSMQIQLLRIYHNINSNAEKYTILWFVYVDMLLIFVANGITLNIKILFTFTFTILSTNF